MTDWINRDFYPFEPHYADVPNGRMHYVDEGKGHPIVMVHGTPTWSFLYRHLIDGLRDDYRVIAPDNLGFGLSDKPTDYSYRPVDQARNLAAFIDGLGLDDFTLVVHDFGGPIGLPYALDHPARVRRLVMFNTWLWSLRDERMIALAGNVMGGGFGRFLYKRFNFSANVLMPSMYGDRSKLTPEIHNHYKRPFDNQTARHAAWVYARELLGSAEWYEDLWARRDALRGIPALLLWGMKDSNFDAGFLARWESVFDHAQTERYPDAGHFVQEEQGTALVPTIRAFVGTAAGEPA
jgi:pimeloyl-ACP methyl ester carboxylesterase